MGWSHRVFQSIASRRRQYYVRNRELLGNFPVAPDHEKREDKVLAGDGDLNENQTQGWQYCHARWHFFRSGFSFCGHYLSSRPSGPTTLPDGETACEQCKTEKARHVPVSVFGVPESPDA